MAKIAMYGAGMMGSGMVERWLAHGDQVNVWNRTTAKARPLEKAGATVFEDPVAAAQGVDSIHVMLADDASVDALLDQILPHLPKGTLVVDHTTVTPHGTAAHAQRAAKAGVEFLHAPVFMSPQACRDGGGLMVVSAPEARFRRAEAELKRMTGELWYVGERPDKAAALKLFGNAMIFTIVAGLADVYALAKGVGIDAREAHELFTHFKASATVEIRGKKMASGDFSSTFDLKMARKDARLMLETAERTGEELYVLPAVARRMDEMLAEGYAHKDVCVLGIEAVPEPAAAS